MAHVLMCGMRRWRAQADGGCGGSQVTRKCPQRIRLEHAQCDDDPDEPRRTHRGAVANAIRAADAHTTTRSYAQPSSAASACRTRRVGQVPVRRPEPSRDQGTSHKALLALAQTG